MLCDENGNQALIDAILKALHVTVRGLGPDGVTVNQLGLGANKGAFVNLLSEGITGVAHNRRLSSTATTYARATNGADFTAVGGVAEVYITAINPAATPSTTEDRVLVVFDAPSEAVATAWLADTGGQAVEIQQFSIPLGVRMGPYRFTDADGVATNIDWIDFQTFVDANVIIFIEGVQA